MGLDLKNYKKYLKHNENNEIKDLPEEIQKIVEQRKKAREEKNWSKSDELRDKLKEKGYLVKDMPDGMKLEEIK